MHTEEAAARRSSEKNRNTVPCYARRREMRHKWKGGRLTRDVMYTLLVHLRINYLLIFLSLTHKLICLLALFFYLCVSCHDNKIVLVEEILSSFISNSETRRRNKNERENILIRWWWSWGEGKTKKKVKQQENENQRERGKKTKSFLVARWREKWRERWERWLSCFSLHRHKWPFKLYASTAQREREDGDENIFFLSFPSREAATCAAVASAWSSREHVSCLQHKEMNKYLRLRMK